MVNEVRLIGRVGKDPEFKVTAGGNAMARFTLATTERFKGKDGQKTETTSWHKLIVWGKLAEVARDYIHKGSLLYVDGRINYGNYEKDGVKVYTTDIVVSNFQMLSGKGESGSGSAPQPAPADKGGFGDDDLPF